LIFGSSGLRASDIKLRRKEIPSAVHPSPNYSLPGYLRYDRIKITRTQQMRYDVAKLVPAYEVHVGLIEAREKSDAAAVARVSLSVPVWVGLTTENSLD
jgi:hypothetical protein